MSMTMSRGDVKLAKSHGVGVSPGEWSQVPRSEGKSRGVESSPGVSKLCLPTDILIQVGVRTPRSSETRSS